MTSDSERGPKITYKNLIKMGGARANTRGCLSFKGKKLKKNINKTKILRCHGYHLKAFLMLYPNIFSDFKNLLK